MDEPRAFVASGDLAAMSELLTRGRLAGADTYYVHVGDLCWWLHYPPLGYDMLQHVYLWDDADRPGRLSAWALLTPGDIAWDAFVQPELIGSPRAKAINLWAARRAEALAAETGRAGVRRMWISATDAWLGGLLTELGYRSAATDVLLARSLSDGVPEPIVPPGFGVGDMLGATDPSVRVRASYEAFANAAPWAAYLDRYTRFRDSPVYDGGRDLVVRAPDGQVAAFCIVWADPRTGVGHFEPVGVHPGFRQRGLGRAVVIAGLRRLKNLGMGSATVCAAERNTPAIALYRSSGFQAEGRLLTYELSLPSGATPSGCGAARAPTGGPKTGP